MNIAGLAQAAPGHRADAARAAGDEAADRRGALGGRMQPQFLAQRPKLRVDQMHARAGLRRGCGRARPARSRPSRSCRAARRLRAARPGRNCRCRRRAASAAARRRAQAAATRITSASLRGMTTMSARLPSSLGREHLRVPEIIARAPAHQRGVDADRERRRCPRCSAASLSGISPARRSPRDLGLAVLLQQLVEPRAHDHARTIRGHVHLDLAAHVDDRVGVGRFQDFAVLLDDRAIPGDAAPRSSNPPRGRCGTGSARAGSSRRRSASPN